MKHLWAWQAAFRFHHRVQLCLRSGCTYTRRRVEAIEWGGQKPSYRHRASRWAYRARPGLAYRLLRRVTLCSGARQLSQKALESQEGLTTRDSHKLR